MPPVFPVRLRWPPAPEAMRYRVLVRNLVPGQLVKLESDGAEVTAAIAPPADCGRPEWRVQVAAPDGTWSDYLPYMEWPTAGEDAIELRWPEDGADLHRIVVHDDSGDELILKAATLERSYLLDRSRLEPEHLYRWRVQRWEGGAWRDSGPYMPLPVEDSSETLTPSPVALDSSSPPEVFTEEAAPASILSVRDVQSPGVVDQGRALFLFTSDTEVHLRWMAEPDHRRGIEQHIFGRLDGDAVGIGLQMQLLDDHGFKGTFFVDVLAEFQFGEGSLQPVFDEILGRGHDVQLHLHPAPHLRFARDERIRALSHATTYDDPAAFRAAMELAIELFERRAGSHPVAYRAGAYRIFDSHFGVLAELGIVIDSSVNPLKNCNVQPWLQARTQPAWVGGVLEVPVTWYLRHDGTRWRAEQLAPVRSATVQRDAIAACSGTPDGPPTAICYIAHSYSFLGATRTADSVLWSEWNQRWEQLVGPEERAISGYNVGAPLVQLDHVDRGRIDTFTQLLDDLSKRPALSGIAFSELARQRDVWKGLNRPIDPVPSVGGRIDRPRSTAMRRYSGSYLSRLESVS
jgi:hypothetical protein